MRRSLVALVVLSAVALPLAACEQAAYVGVENRSSVAIAVEWDDRTMLVPPGGKLDRTYGVLNEDSTIIITNTDDPSDIRTHTFGPTTEATVIVTGPPLLLSLKDKGSSVLPFD